jgi:glycosyltransferase involved in cell wall biosynthesis
MKKILVLNWKDIRHPEAGGAEVVLHELLVRLIKDGYQVTLLTAQYRNSSQVDNIDGIDIIRVPGGRVMHSFKAVAYYIKELRGKFDIVIEQVNTAPYFVSWFTKGEKTFQFYHMLCREIWFFEMTGIVGWIGYLLLEPIALILQSIIARIKKSSIITISQSTKNDMVRFGFDKNNIHIISEGIDNKPLDSLKDSQPKEKDFTVLFHSSLRQMKRPIEVFKAFGVFVKEQPEAKLWISGGGDQTKLREYAEENKFIDRVTFWGRTSQEQKLELMQKASVICSTSIKEGWGLIVTEANSMGTPAISYDVDGLRDSTSFGGGVVCKEDYRDMAKALTDMSDIFYNNPDKYLAFREKALESSKLVNFDQSYQDFADIIL